MFRMAGFRAFYDFKNYDGSSEIFLSEDESRHLCGSLRARSGDKVDVFDLSGNVFSCEILDPSKKRTSLKTLFRKKIEERSADIFVAQCTPKGKTFDEIMRGAIEIGAAGIYPLNSERTEAKTTPQDSERKAEKRRERAVEYIKQSGNFFPFEIFETRNIGEFLKNSSFDAKFVASLRKDAKPILSELRELKFEGKIRACVLIGPEGDLSDSEYDSASESGFKPVTLGKSVMRCDTAALFSLSVLSAFFASR